MKKINKLFEKIPAEIELIVINDQVNVFYFSGFWGSNGVIVATREKQYFITDSRYTEKAKKNVYKNYEIIDQKNIISIDHFIDELKFENMKLGISFEKNNINDYLKFSKKFNLIDISNYIANMRIIKSKEEIEFIIKSQNIAEKSLYMLYENIYEGMTELELKGRFYAMALKNGAEDLSFDTIVAFGKNSSIPHHESGNNKLKFGDTILIDCGVKYNHYCSDMTRTVYWGKGNEKLKKNYNHVYEAVQIAESEIQNSLNISLASKKINNYFEKNGVRHLYLHSLGHGVGLDIHEEPFYRKSSKDLILQKNMVFTIEPGLYLENAGGIRLENLYFISEKNELKKINNKDIKYKII